MRRLLLVGFVLAFCAIGIFDPIFGPHGKANAQGTAFGIAPTNSGSISVTSSSSRLQLGANGSTILLQNTGTTDAFVAFGTVTVVATTGTAGTSHSLPAGKSLFFNAPPLSYVAAITASSTTTINVTQGVGASAVGGGGSSGGGGGGAITIASGAVASGAYSSGSIASGAFASGSVSSGAFASGSLAAGSMVDLLTMRGTKAPGTAAANSILNGAVYTAAGITLTDGQQAALQFSSTGKLQIQIDPTQINANGFATGANSSPTAGASDQFGLAADTVCSTDNGTCTLLALLKRTNARLTSLIANAPDPCSTTAKTNFPISFQTTTLTQQIAASGSNKIYICSLSLIASAATVFSVSGGTGSNCASNQLGILGVAGTATHGLSLAANGGLTFGNGLGTVAVTAASSALCLVQSGAGDLSGNITYVYAP